jgi:hypothetical protein
MDLVKRINELFAVLFVVSSACVHQPLVVLKRLCQVDGLDMLIYRQVSDQVRQHRLSGSQETGHLQGISKRLTALYCGYMVGVYSQSE